MRPTSLAVAALALWLSPARETRAQDRDLLPMSFVRVDTNVSRQFEADWLRLQKLGKEWAYCVTRWSLAWTQDGDTAYVVEEVDRAPARSGKHELGELECPETARFVGPAIAHAHPSGDCSPSRADATYAVAHAIPFALIVCGPRSTAGYTGQQFLWISRGVLSERGPVLAPEPKY
jgi:hypothetical protein